MKVDKETIAVDDNVVAARDVLEENYPNNNGRANREANNYNSNFLNNQEKCEIFQQESYTKEIYQNVSTGLPELYNWHTPVDGAYTPSPAASPTVSPMTTHHIQDTVIIDMENNNIPDLQQTNVDISGHVSLDNKKTWYSSWYASWYKPNKSGSWWSQSLRYCLKMIIKLSHVMTIMCWYGKFIKKKKLQAQV